MIRTIGIADREILEQNLKRLKLRHVRHTLDAVSYTHLDVYKRQVAGLTHHRTCRSFITARLTVY